MGKRGPGKEPTKLRLLKGNPGKRALPRNEPEPPPLPTINPPEYLSQAGRVVWERNAPVLIALNILTQADADTFATLCEALAEHHEATKKIEDEGFTTRSDKGNLLQSPWVGIRHRAADVIAKYASRFGMTPSDRVALAIEKPAQDDFDKFIEQPQAACYTKQ